MPYQQVFICFLEKIKRENFFGRNINFSGNVPIIYMKDMIQKLEKLCPDKCTLLEKANTTTHEEASR